MDDFDDILKKAMSGNKEALDLFICHIKMVDLLNEVSVHAARTYKQDRDDIRDKLLMTVYQSITALSEPNHLRAWCYQIAKGYCLDEIRHNTVVMSSMDEIRRSTFDDSKRLGGKPLIQSTNALTPEQEFLLNERLSRVYRQYPDAIVIGWALGHSPAEIAQESGIPLKTVYRLLRKMQGSLLEESLSEIQSIKKLEKESGNNKITSLELIQVIETVKKLTPGLIAHLQSHESDLERLRWDVFEHLVAEFLASGGFHDVRLVGRNPQTSADIFAAHFIDFIGMKVRYFIEVKRWKKKVGVNIIDQVYGAMVNEREKFGWHAAMIVSLVGYKDFEKYDRQSLALKGIVLKDRDDLLMWLRGYKRNSNGLWLPEPDTILESKKLT
jgi:DNA-directed RNA polymerase specialized sigma24 family protein